LLVYGCETDVRRRLALRAPRHAVDDVAHDALVRAVASAFDGSSEGEFRGWLNMIVERTAVDWCRRSKRRPAEAPLPSEHQSEEDVWGEEPLSTPPGAVELRMIVDEVIGRSARSTGPWSRCTCSGR
jgi:DNA-directed RNA polymerase specialized sigma24 family protein